ncbi:MAG: hypothetical protein J6Q28_05755 [Alistipes sp.]|nr:hypothetical protein [Alistipes sp.]
MGRVRRAYAFVLVAIYAVATILSSVSLLVCDHHHHHHHSCKSKCCAHLGVTIAKDCCDHHHPILGDNHTDFIESRNDSRTAAALSLLFAPVVTTSVGEELSLSSYAKYERLELRDIGTPSDSYRRGLSLRAPPALA